MTEINVSPKTPINLFKLQVRLNDVGWPQFSGRPAGPVAWCSVHRQTDRQPALCHKAGSQCSNCFPHLWSFIFFFGQSTDEHKRQNPQRRSDSLTEYAMIVNRLTHTYTHYIYIYIYIYSGLRQTQHKTCKVISSGLFTGHYQTYIIRTCERTVQSSTMWKKL